MVAKPVPQAWREKVRVADSVRGMEIRSAIATYFAALRSGDVDSIPLDRNVQFDGVLLEEPILGEQALREFLAGLAENIASLKVHQTIVEGDNACAIFTWVTPSGIKIDMCDQFHFKDGRIVYLRPFFDPRPLFRD